jgi:ribosomal-protein-alanine N-acetyltransferase
MKLRRASSDDTPVLAAIHAQCFTEEVWDRAAIAGLMATPGTLALMDEDAGGFILVRAAAGESEVLTLGVKPAARRRGLARSLVLKGAEAAADAGAAVMFLEVNATNNAAIALYKGLGFAEVGRRKAYYVGPHGMREDALVLNAAIPLLRV